MLYPFATDSYTMTMSVGLPYDAPHTEGQTFYKYTRNYAVLKIVIPYAVPAGYMIKLAFTSVYMYTGQVYANF